MSITERRKRTPPVALTIGGSDSGAGAGIQADMKAFAANKVFGTTVITAVTAQNTQGIQASQPISSELVSAQIKSIISDFMVRAVKTGMLASKENISLVADFAASGAFERLVVDPVLVSSSGTRLIDNGAETLYLEKLIPRATLVTPNLYEVKALLGKMPTNFEEMISAARQFKKLGPRYVLIKGGHLHGSESTDIFYDGQTILKLSASRIQTDNIHGTGCTLSAAITANLARGMDVVEAVKTAKIYITRTIKAGSLWQLGRGSGPVDQFIWASQEEMNSLAAEPVI
ncbi:MAG: bifunctional hydroxymethylpyrimidine kinase/phosphomethylpyrimidine kinase [Actinobacteria bacterium]|nr:bifunctional hydroxymethylpyrimidine kinase/phosphomethylpyrimidine kinase [Actinomycetota bacterium]